MNQTYKDAIAGVAESIRATNPQQAATLYWALNEIERDHATEFERCNAIGQAAQDMIRHVLSRNAPVSCN